MSGLEVRVVDNVIVVAEGFGPPGPQGPGVPVGGTTGQVLAKVSNTDNDTAWQDQSGGVGAAVLYTAQTLTAPQKAQGRSNIDAEQVGVAATADAAHVLAADPHGDRAFATAADAAHVIAADPHGDRAFATAADAAHAAAAGAHPIAGVSGLSAALALLAPLLSPALTGAPTTPTATPGTANTQIASTAFVAAAIAALLNSAPGALDTLDELAAALGDDPNFAATITNALAGKLAKASNLSDLVDAAAARGNLGAGTVGAQVFTASTAAAIRTLLELGGAALLAVGTTAGTVAAGNDSRVVGALQSSGGTLSGAIACADNELRRPILLDYAVKQQALGNVSGATSINIEAGNAVTATATGAVTWTFSNPAPAGNECAIFLTLTNGGVGAQTWPASVDWDATAGAPTLTASGIDKLLFVTSDAGTRWDGFLCGKGMT